ncbi:MAG: ATP-binding protein [Massilia sp.]
MANNRLADFIRTNMEPILVAWEDFARTIEPPALTMSDEQLRDHARQMLLVFADDLDQPQSDQERLDKSQGLGERTRMDTAAEVHAVARLLSGYSVVQLVSEYRALRSSVLTLWSAASPNNMATDMADTTRFNEAVDQALAESVERYQALVNKSQNMFLAILGHDLRNPLGTLVTGSDFIMQAADVPPKYALVATRMFRSAKRMNRLITDLIDFTRTQLGRDLPISAKDGDLVTVCRQIVSELRTVHGQRQITLKEPHQLLALFDEDRIAQMLSNLIGNALQYGSADAPIVVTLAGTSDMATISVNNRGPTIAADKLATIFDPLVRLASADQERAEENTSLGIGLFIARQIAHAHGGQISVTSSDADGTSFTLTMPRWHALPPRTEPK